MALLIRASSPSPASGAEVERISMSSSFMRGPQAVGFDHNLRVTGLHGQDDLMKVVLAGNPDEFNADSAIPRGGIPNPFMIRSESEP